jgi:hypothetical protein
MTRISVPGIEVNGSETASRRMPTVAAVGVRIGTENWN